MSVIRKRPGLLVHAYIAFLVASILTTYRAEMISMSTQITQCVTDSHNGHQVESWSMSCDCPGLWLDFFGQPHCETCNPPPVAVMVAARYVRYSDGWQLTSDRRKSSPPPGGSAPRFFGDWDAFGDELQRGYFAPIADRPEYVPCSHDAGTRREHCSNGIWERELCARCGRLLRLV